MSGSPRSFIDSAVKLSDSSYSENDYNDNIDFDDQTDKLSTLSTDIINKSGFFNQVGRFVKYILIISKNTLI